MTLRKTFLQDLEEARDLKGSTDAVKVLKTLEYREEQQQIAMCLKAVNRKQP